MALIRGKVRSLPVMMEDLLTMVNREWIPMLRQLVDTVNARMGMVRTATADYTAVSGDQYILVDSSDATAEVTLPTASGSRMRITVRDLGGGAVVTVKPAAGEELNGGTGSVDITGGSIDVVSDGSADWWSISSV